MTDEEIPYNLAAIRELLLAAFDAEDLRRFCRDRPMFRPIVGRLGPGHGHDDMVEELITYCDTYLLFPDLLAEVRQLNPRQYARFEPALRIKDVEKPREEKPARLAPETLTITRPISLQLVCVPAGEFLMGSVVARDKDAMNDELPPHPVYVAEFYIAKYPLVNDQYQGFVRATGSGTPGHWRGGEIPWDKGNHPVVNLAWHDAIAFCTWLSRETGLPFRLPTEAEWEKAMRGIDGRIYPWGDEPPDERRCNFGGAIGDTTAIGRYSPQGDSPYGCADMAGNVWEWCQSLYKGYPYAADDREEVDADGYRVLRGGAFCHDRTTMRCACRDRNPPGDSHGGLGFRVVLARGLPLASESVGL